MLGHSGFCLICICIPLALKPAPLRLSGIHIGQSSHIHVVTISMAQVVCRHKHMIACTSTRATGPSACVYSV